MSVIPDPIDDRGPGIGPDGNAWPRLFVLANGIETRCPTIEAVKTATPIGWVDPKSTPFADGYDLGGRE